MKVYALYRYPVKSLGGQSVSELVPQQRGFQDDRRWMFTDTSGKFISQRNNVQLARFSAEVVGDTLSFFDVQSGEQVGAVAGARVVGEKSEVTVWDDTFPATEIKSEALYALTRKLGVPDARLFYMDAGDERPVDSRYARPVESVSFADGYPYLVATTASLESLASLLDEPQIDMARFRPNIVVTTREAWLEDNWARLDINGHQFRLPKPCARCIMVTHEPGTGDRDLRVLATLNQHRKVDNKLLFGMNACWESGTGLLRVGDVVNVID
ncbi:MOSC domain-containing protein [Neolewinella antarctica]|uniref:MOSC domain-containing protein n=1 Tax=Neolewinella antarctica TaxID=442734 RepID=A0ABX0X6Y8_9BACT|nr:MOSC N-terminal beta barrel domain-containing protein [Neolewinella antarctica]NJC24991.1 hypothetical protein [Neolewinella antarctica]